MERVAVLLNKLQEQLAQGSSVNNMLITAQLLQSELTQMVAQINGQNKPLVSVMVPGAVQFNSSTSISTTPQYKPVPKPDPGPTTDPGTESEPLPEPLPHPGPRPEPEPAPMPALVETKPWQNSVHENPTNNWPLDPALEIPTLAHQDKVYFELNDVMSENGSSLNEKLKEEKLEMGTVLQESPIRDLKKAISINERQRFINELFRGDETMYERSVKTINGFNIYAEAEYWIQRELKLKVGWDASVETVKIFDQLVKRRFS